jgi:hypothetical protein
MTHLSDVANKWPMVSVIGGIVLAFCCATPLVWLFSNLLVDELWLLSQSQ